MHENTSIFSEFDHHEDLLRSEVGKNVWKSAAVQSSLPSSFFFAQRMRFSGSEDLTMFGKHFDASNSLNAEAMEILRGLLQQLRTKPNTVRLSATRVSVISCVSRKPGFHGGSDHDAARTLLGCDTGPGEYS